ncbi:hypothetical protein CLF_110068 [Clonorchis sinensis]|uniref:Sugar phosphate phosphatase n=1 Tax=Clonorchis sinensis TaxID=79923 RepID=G7YK71_CLOSI|nr:hypothetical protein CLF_110068 [Clonorchis sinensis]
MLIGDLTYPVLPAHFTAGRWYVVNQLLSRYISPEFGDLNYRKLVGDRSWIPDNPQHKLNAFRAMQLGRTVSSDGLIDCKCTPVSESTSDSRKHPLGAPVDCRCHTGDSPSSPPLVIALRVAKADVAVGLSPEMLRKVTTESSDWWTLGRYGLVQLVSPLYFG